MRLFLRVIGYLFALWLVVTVALAVWYWQLIVMVATYNTIILPPMYGEPANEAEAHAQDIDYLRKLITIDRSFSEESKKAFTDHLDEMDTRTGTMSLADLYLGVSKAVALADNGHTNISDQPLYRQFKTIRAKLYLFGDGLYITRAAAAYSDTVGARVVAVEGRDTDFIISMLQQYRGGNQAWRRLLMPLMIESPEFLHAAGLAASPDEVTMTLEGPDGKTRDVTFAASLIENADTISRRRLWMALKPGVLADEDESWTRAFKATGNDVPLYLRDMDDPIYAPLPGNGHYIRTKRGFGGPNQSIQDFFKEALAGIEDGALDYLVVDYRLNSGGDYTRSIDFAKIAPTKVKDGGKLYLAVGPQTFSAAIVTVSMLKYYGGDKSVILGTPMGDRGQFWAERGMNFMLPNSKFYINYATGYHDWENGCEDHPYCFTLNLKHQVPAGSLAPTVILDSTFADYASGRDGVMEWILSKHPSMMDGGTVTQ